MKIELSRSRYLNGEQVKNFYQQLTARIQALPGVEPVGMIDRFPLGPSMAISRFVVEGRPAEPGREPLTQMRRADYHFFEMMRIPLRRGRLFNKKDDLQDNNVIINETMARSFFPRQDPVGKRILMHFGARSCDGC